MRIIEIGYPQEAPKGPGKHMAELERNSWMSPFED